MRNKYENFEFDDACIDELTKYIGKTEIRGLNSPKSTASNTRNCLSCTLEFESEGKHNRICDCCRKENGF